MSEIYECNIRELVNLPVEAHDTRTIDWNKNAHEILADEDSEEEDEEVEDLACPSAPSVTISEAEECIRNLKLFTTERGNTILLESLMDFTSVVT